jgi:hypothetical protein
VAEEAIVCCIILVLAYLGPRAAIIVWWLLEPGRWDEAFNTFIWPTLGFVFLPSTTLMWVVVQPSDVEGFDWVWLGLAVLLDLTMYSGGIYKRQQIPGYNRLATA